MSKLYYIIVLIVVLTIATLTYKLSSSIDKSPETADPSLRHDPDYFISVFNATRYDKSGTASYNLSAQHLEHFPDNDTIEVQHPVVKIFDKTEPVWQASSTNGVGYKNTEILHLSGNVKIERQSPNPDQRLLLETDKLHIDFTKKHARTDSKVKITGKNSTINAIGMDVNLENGTLTLKSQARGHYVPD